jgi:hypothetical protein
LIIELAAGRLPGEVWLAIVISSGSQSIWFSTGVALVALASALLGVWRLTSSWAGGGLIFWQQLALRMPVFWVQVRFDWDCVVRAKGVIAAA